MADLRPVYVADDGDVKGPASSSNNFLPLFADTTGKLLKSSGTGVTTQGLAILDDNTPAEQRNTIGLGQVNNTSDVNKPVSTAQQTALNLKQDKLLYTPVQQGGGIGQATNKIFIGFGAGRLKATVDSTDFGNVIFDGNTATESVVGVAKVATTPIATAGANDTDMMTPLKTKQAIAAQVSPPAQATESVAGVVELATSAETMAGTDATRAVVPSGLQTKISGVVSGEYPTTLGAQVVFNHNLGVVPFMVEFSFVCITAQGGWSPGDVVHRGNWYQNSTGTDGSPGIFWYNETATQVTFGLGSTILLLPTKTTGYRFALTAANWKFTARVIG